MKILGRIISSLVIASTMLGAVALILMMLQIVADVVFKNIFSWPLPLTSIFVANYYMVIVAFLPLALAEKLSRHISVELLFQHFSSTWKRWVGGCICLFAGVVSAGVAWQLWWEALKRFRAGTFIVEQSISMPTWPSYFVLPIGFGLLALVLFYRTGIVVTGFSSGLHEEPLDGAKASEKV